MEDEDGRRRLGGSFGAFRSEPDLSCLGAPWRTRRALEELTFQEAEHIRGLQSTAGCMPSEAIRAHQRFRAELYAGLTAHAARILAAHVARPYELGGRLYLSPD